MTVQLAAFINLFFAPVLTIYLHERKSGRPLVPSVELLFRYCITTCLHFILTKLVLLALSQVAPTASFTFDSMRYTVVALFSAWLLAQLYALFRYIKVELQVTRLEQSGGEPSTKNGRKKDVSGKDETKQH